MDSSSSTSVTPSQAEAKPEKVVYKTKAIQFLDRTVSIILQNNNGPCPLISICNALSLKNNLNLNPNIPEVSQEKLLTLVADRLIDLDSKIDNTDADYGENQRQNIADAIDLLPKLTTGIDVNIKFRRIDDFESTPECAIFDLLDIPLYHGWIVDPQDIETKNVIGSKSYNFLAEKLASLDTQATEYDRIENLGEDGVDFVAATTATLGVPSPSLSRNQSFTDSPQSAKKGSMEEAVDNLRLLKLLMPENPSSAPCSLPKTDQSSIENSDCDPQIQNDKPLSSEEIPTSSSDFLAESRTNKHVENEFTSTSDLDDQSNLTNDRKSGDSPILPTAFADLGPSSDQAHNTDNPKVLNSIIDVSEPMYEGEECIMGTGTAVNQIQEPIYEGEAVLSKQVDCGCIDADPKERITVAQGELIRNYLNSSQLTIYGLFCLQGEVKEHEICVFFRNNHFNTMIKHEGELYILATDQGFINQPDLVWEKLNRVNGDTVYVMGNFKEFKMDDHFNGTWNVHNALASTADYIASMNSVTRSDSVIDSDLQLAIALQEQEYEQEQTQRSLQPPVASGSGLNAGPQVSHSGGKHTPPSSSNQLPSLKEKCNIM